MNRAREQDLSGKVAVITGASRGLGRATALILASRGCSILGTCSSDNSLYHIDSLRQTVLDLPKIDGQQPKVVGIVADIFTSPSSVAKAIADKIDAEFGGKLDIFVNNAAATDRGGPGELDDEHVQGYLGANIHCPIAIVEEFVNRKMFRPNSRIVCIASTRARRVSGLRTLYAATKSANEALCRCWADAFGGGHPQYNFMTGTTANAVIVGITNTELLQKFPPEILQAAEQEFMSSQAIKRLGQPEDVAEVVGILVREEARWITGSSIAADGGYLKLG